MPYLPPASNLPPRARRVMDPLKHFLHTETSSGLVLAVAALLALAWANGAPGGYQDFWHTQIGVSVGDWTASTTLQKFVKDGLMTLFFLVVGLEIKREVTIGELAERRLALVPACAALGGILLPAALYAALNAGGAGAAGWGIPMATDIAFALGALSLLRRHVPTALAAFLLGIAVIDDIVAIAVIAVFYSSGVQFAWLGAALVCLALMWVLFAWEVRLAVPYVVVGIAAWAAMARSGVSPTLAGVAVGLLVPVHALVVPADAAGRAADIAARMLAPEEPAPSSLTAWRRVDDLGRQAVPQAERLAAVLHPWSAFVVLPLFALAFAGVQMDAESLSHAVTSPVAVGIVLGLVFGKLGGVLLGTWLPVRLGWGGLPEGVAWPHIAGVAALAGIGFTVSMFVASLAFTDAALVDDARIGIIAASLVAGAFGAVLLRLVARKSALDVPEPAEDG